MKSLLALTCLLFGFTAGSPAADTPAEHTEKMNNIRKMIELTGGAKIVDQIFDSMATQVKDPKQQEIFQQFRKEIDMKQIYDIMIPAYDKYLSGDDVKAILGFYQSPAGKRLLTSQPKIMADSMPRLMAWSQEISKRLMEKMADKTKEKGTQ